MRPLVLESIIRFDNAGLTFVVLLLGAAVVFLVASLPVVAARNRRLGHAEAEPVLQRDLARSIGKWQSRGERIRELEFELAEVREKYAALSGAMAHAYHLAGAPTEKQRHLVLLGGKRR